MLEHLFGSTTRHKLLHVFLNNPDDQFYVRELTRLLDTQINAVRRELQNLVALGIVYEISGLEGLDPKKKYYTADSEFIIFPELKSLLDKNEFLTHKAFAKSIKKLGKIDYLAMAGRVVGGEDMGVDLLIVGSIPKKTFDVALNRVQKQLQREINYTLFDRDEFMYRRSVADKFIYSILEGKKVVIVDKLLDV